MLNVENSTRLLVHVHLHTTTEVRKLYTGRQILSNSQHIATSLNRVLYRRLQFSRRYNPTNLTVKTRVPSRPNRSLTRVNRHTHTAETAYNLRRSKSASNCKQRSHFTIRSPHKYLHVYNGTRLGHTILP